MLTLRELKALEPDLPALIVVITPACLWIPANRHNFGGAGRPAGRLLHRWVEKMNELDWVPDLAKPIFEQMAKPPLTPDRKSVLDRLSRDKRMKNVFHRRS